MPRLIFLAPFICTWFLFFIPAIDLLVFLIGHEHVHSDYTTVPERKVALILGTSSLLENGQSSPWFAARMKAAYDLYSQGKVKWLLVSGDNSFESYNEPRRMKEALIRLGIPPDKIIMDYAGFSTLDSIMRAKKVFGQLDPVVVSQDFQNERALFIAKFSGMDAVACNAPVKVSGMTTLSMLTREALARVKAFFDVFILHTQPRFLGDMIQIG